MIFSDEFVNSIDSIKANLIQNKVVIVEDILTTHFFTYLSSLYSTKEFSLVDEALDGRYQEYTLIDEKAVQRIFVLFNSQEVLELFSRLTDSHVFKIIPKLIYQTPEVGGIEWHDDLSEDEEDSCTRCVGLRINFTDELLDGGEFEFQSTSLENDISIPSTPLGAACFFTIGRGNRHRVRPFKQGIRKSLLVFVVKKKG